MRGPAFNLVNGALLMAISVVLTRFASFYVLPSIRVGFGPVPIYLAGLLMGPVHGGGVGALSDLLGFWLNTGGYAFPNPLITLAFACRGTLPPLLLKLLGGEISFRRLLAVLALTEVVAGLLLTTLGLSQILGVPFAKLLLPRMVSTSIHVFAYSLIVYPVYVKVYSLLGGACYTPLATRR